MSNNNKAFFDDKQKKLLRELLSSVSGEQAAWLANFISENAKAGNFVAEDAAASSSAIPLTILFGSESGNSETLADKAKKLSAKMGFKPVVKDMFNTKPEDLVSAKNLLIIVSTWGEGDPPERSVNFFKAIKSDNVATKFYKDVNFAVLALGDTSYVNFCQAGKDMDSRFEQLGGNRIFNRVDCDVDFNANALKFIESVLPKFLEASGVDISKIETPKVKATDFLAIFSGTEYDQTKPYTAEVKDKVLLNEKGSLKETYHIEINLEGSGIKYQAGDALGIIPLNDSSLVDDILKVTKLSGDTLIDGKTLRELLIHEYDINALTKPVIEAYANLTLNTKIKEIAAKKDVSEYTYGRELIDLLVEFPHKNIKAEELLKILRKLPHRLYSISSSTASVGDEVHLTIATVRYEANGRKRKGVASGHIADDLKTGDKVKIFIKENKNFRLPENNNTPIIMVGPGTGIAPFRAFLQQRDAENAKGRNWLFFGEQHYLLDFFYQLEWQELKEKGLLTNFDAGFSRDQPEKIYVQNKMWDRRKELYEWLEQGAYFYVCGDEKRMAKDVDAMLHNIIVDSSGKNTEFAKEYVEKMKNDRRYLRDVY